MEIKDIVGYYVLDSRANPTVEVEVTLVDGTRGRGTVPSGTSTGQYEAHEMRDGDEHRYGGKSVDKAIGHVNDVIRPALVGRAVDEQEEIDHAIIELDGTPHKERLGANAILGVSMAVAAAAARAKNQELFEYLGGGNGTLLPLPEIQIIGGGAHAAWATDVQDYLIIANGAQTYEQTLEMTHRVYHATGEILGAAGKRCGVADEGGYWPIVENNHQPLDILVEAIQRAGYVPGSDVAISLDIAASDLYDSKEGIYRFKLEDRRFSTEEFAGQIVDWCDRYPIISIEDPLADEDIDGWRAISQQMGTRVQLIGDDLFTTNPERIRAGIEGSQANAVLIKLNQIGTVTETIRAIRMTQEAGWLPIVSARSGETEDAFISHLAVATNAGQLKVGSITRGERTAKWNELLRIARQLGPNAEFQGGRIFDKILSSRFYSSEAAAK